MSLRKAPKAGSHSPAQQAAGPRSRPFNFWMHAVAVAQVLRPRFARGLPHPGDELTGEGLHGRAVDDATAPELVIPASEAASPGRARAGRAAPPRAVACSAPASMQSSTPSICARVASSVASCSRRREQPPPARLRFEAHRPAEELLRVMVGVVLPDAQLIEPAAQRVRVGARSAAEVDPGALHRQHRGDDVVADTCQHAVQVKPQRHAAMDERHAGPAGPARWCAADHPARIPP